MAAIERVAVIGVDHWHAELHLPALRKAGKQIVGVSSADAAVAERWAAQVGAKAWTDYRRMIDEAKPDFVVGMARHAQMPPVCSFLLETGLPFIHEKPLGLNAEQVQPLAEMARQRGAFAAIPFVNRYSPLWAEVESLRAAGRLGELSHAHFRVINGPPSRYENDGAGWMLDPAYSGGGCLRNLGVHMVDAFLALTGEPVEVVGAQTSRKVYGTPVEEFATAILRSQSGTLGTIEAGYSFASIADGDYEWRVAAANATLIDREGELLIWTLDDNRRQRRFTPGLGSRYEEFVADSLRRAEQGQPPKASIEDCYRVVQVIDAIYQVAAR